MPIFPLCVYPWAGLIILDGDKDFGLVRPCTWSLRYVGDTATQSIQEIWNGPGYQDFRRRMLTGDINGYCPPTCPNRKRPIGEWLLYLGRLMKYRNTNHLLNFAEVVQRRTQLNSMPIFLKVTPTLACNLRCIMCYQTNDAHTFLPDRVLEELFLFFPKSTVLRIHGGELFASPNGLKFLKRIGTLKRQPSIQLVTNGTFPIEGGLEILRNLNIRLLFVSLDAATPETFNSIRIGGYWDIVIGNLEKLCMLSRSRKGKFKVSISFSLLTLNYKDLKDCAILAHKLSADMYVNYVYFVPPAQNHLLLSENPELHSEVISHLKEALSYAKTMRMPMAKMTLRIALARLISRVPRIE